MTKDDPDALKAELIRLRRRNYELDLWVKRGRLVNRESVNRQWLRRSNDCRVQLEALPSLVMELAADDPDEKLRVRSAAMRIVVERLFRLAGKPEAFEEWSKTNA